MKYSRFKMPDPELRCSYCRSKNKQVIKYTKTGFPERSVVVLRCCDCGKVEYFSSCIEENIVSILTSPYEVEIFCCSRLCPHHCEYFRPRHRMDDEEPIKVGPEFERDMRKPEFISTSQQPLIGTPNGPFKPLHMFARKKKDS